MKNEPMQCPSPVSKDDPIDDFDSESPTLDRWFTAHACPMRNPVPRVPNVVREAGRVVAFYSLAIGSVGRARAPGGIRRHMPDPVPVMILARLAVARTHQGRGSTRHW